MTDMFITLCPFLCLGQRHDFGDFSVGPFASFESMWKDSAFKDAASELVSKFAFANGKRNDNPALVVRIRAGVDGSMLSDDELNSLQLALDFAVIDSNPFYDEDRDYNGAHIATTDNSEVQVWSVRKGSGTVLQRGVLVNIRDLVFDLGGGITRIQSSLETPSPAITHIDRELLEACFRVFVSAESDDGNPIPSRVRTAVRWLSKSWRNTPSIGWDDRIVMLKTAFEALTDSSQSWKSAKRLRGLFERLDSSVPGPETIEGLLWSPDEQKRWTASYQDKQGNVHPVFRTDLEHWFVSFSDARNDIIHDGVAVGLNYYEETAYKGPYFWTAERLLRESAKVQLHLLGHPNLWRDGLGRASFRFSQRLEDFSKPL